jgi:protein-ribulosamine 3-kinase
MGDRKAVDKISGMSMQDTSNDRPLGVANVMTFWEEVSRRISSTIGEPFAIRSHAGIGGGCINEVGVVIGDRGRFFVKTNTADKEGMFAAEFAGLQEIRKSGTVRVPEPVCFGSAEGRAYLVMEYLPLGRRGTEAAIEDFGRRLAAMHAVTRADYGWDRDNTIGSTPQRNGARTEWISFWRSQRLEYQLELAISRGYRRLRGPGNRLLDALPRILANHRPSASLLHGDLWSGNYAFTEAGAVIFDPAVYYGDRETDLAMSELFGRFPDRFYRAYEEAWPLEDGYEVRKILYNLYHILNHLNLFGGGYLSQAEDMIEALL